MFRIPIWRCVLVSLAFSASVVGLAGAQGVPQAGETRDALTIRARVADSLGLRDEAFRLRSRLRDGDFDVGDQIIVQFDGGALVRNDSLVVQEGRMLHLAEPLGDLSLTGVLQSEIGPLIRARVDRLYKNEVVRVTPLLRLSASGALRGYYHFRPDMPLSDAIMKMGATQTTTADIAKIEIKRGDAVVWGSKDVQTALNQGMTLAQLQLEPGDEVNVAPVAPKSWTVWLQYGIPIVSGLVLQYFVFRRR